MNRPTLAGIWGLLSTKRLLFPNRKRHDQIATALLDFSERQLGELASEPRDFDLASEPELSPFFDSLTLQRSKAEIHWGWVQGAAFVGLSRRSFLDILTPKLRTVRDYRYAEEWLLIVNGERISQSIGRPSVEEFETMTVGLPLDRFARIYVFDYPTGRILCWTPEKGWQEEAPANSA